jgi:hypothetical protein
MDFLKCLGWWLEGLGVNMEALYSCILAVI